MTRFTKSANGKYMVHGKSYEMLCGSRAQVWHGTAYKTSGELTKSHLMQNKAGRIVSRKKHTTAKKDNRLVKAGYGTKKGVFGYVMLHGKKGKSHRNGKGKSHGKSRSRKMRGGMYALSPSDYDGKGVGTSGNAVQFAAGNGN